MSKDYYNSSDKNNKTFVNNRPVFKGYGPLSLDVNNVQFNNNMFFIPVLNDDNKPLFLAINCKSLLFNVKSDESWIGWFDPFFTYELNIIDDFCNYKID
tara:strand:+ start:450 stop:746 length:297 start_codon:yes stop_codon:yes gene_type:complete